MLSLLWCLFLLQVVGTVEQVGVSDAWASWWPRLRRASVRGTDEAERRALGMLRLGFSAANILFFLFGLGFLLLG